MLLVISLPVYVCVSRDELFAGARPCKQEHSDTDEHLTRNKGIAKLPRDWNMCGVTGDPVGVALGAEMERPEAPAAANDEDDDDSALRGKAHSNGHSRHHKQSKGVGIIISMPMSEKMGDVA